MNFAVFLLIGVALSAGAAIWVLRPLLRAHSTTPVDQNAVTLEILRNEQAELARAHADGTLSEAEYAHAHEALAQRALEEVSSTEEKTDAQAPVQTYGYRTAALSGVTVSIAAVALYLALGDRDAFNEAIVNAKTPQALIHLLQRGEPEIVIDQTRLQLTRSPDDSQLWFLLARAYYASEQFTQAVAAFEKLNTLEPNNASLLIDWADAIAQTQNQSLAGRATELIDQALALEPEHGKALAMSGAAAFEQGHYEQAITQWEKLRTRVAGTAVAEQVAQSIRRAHIALGQTPTPQIESSPSTSLVKISGRVSISDPLKNQAAPTDTVFVFARATAGSRIPLAVYRTQVKDLPDEFVLDDQLAMSPAHKLSDHTQVSVSARISKSGQAMPQPGDLESRAVTVQTDNPTVLLIIDQVRQ